MCGVSTLERTPVKRKTIIATALQAAGILTVSAGVGFVSFWGGLITLGAGLVVFGVAVERGEG
jgi:CHASE2 domain-containing sensor protein